MDYFKKSSELSALQKQISTFVESMKQCCRDAEPAFISLGEELQHIYADATELTRKTVDAIGLMSGESRQEGILVRIASLVQDTLSELKKRQVNVTANLNSSNQMIQHLSKLYSVCAVIEKMAMFLRIVGLNMDIESARSHKFTEMFGFVTREIRTLSEKILLTVSNIENNTHIASAEQSAACRDIEKDLQGLEELSMNAEKAVHEAIRNIETFTHLSIKAIEYTNKYSGIVAENAAEIVVTIQFHDSMNQRAEHIIKAVQDMETLIARASAAEDKVIRDKSLGAAHVIVGLQINQLNSIVSESQNFYRKGRSAFEHIGSEVHTLTQSLSMLYTSEKEKRSEPLAELTSALSSLHNLLGQGRQLLDRIRESTDHATDTTERLADYLRQVRDFSFQTRLIALNAIIKASYIGREGSTLEVLAHEMAQISDKTNDFAEDVEKILENITYLTKELKNCSYENSKDRGNVRISLKDGIKNISDIYEMFMSKAAEILKGSDDLKTSVENVSETGLLFFPKLYDQLQHHFQKLKEIETQLRPWAKEDIGELAEEFEKLGRRYTMKKERDIHHQVVRSDDPPAIPDHHTETAHGFEDNVELF